jgi:GNAT superfamily N-acetyltransferase
MTLTPFADQHLPSAAELLSARHRAHRAAEPLLPARFEEPAVALKAIEAIWRKPEASGLAAVAGGRLVGYMLGTAHDDSLRGRHVWVSLAGHALAAGENAELYREMYAVLAQRWVDEGHFYHLAQVPASDASALDAWFRLTFAHEQVYALMEVGAMERPSIPAGVEVRRAAPDDLALIMANADWIARHQACSPVFGICLPEAKIGWRKGWAELLSDERSIPWLAFREGRLLSYFLFDPAPSSETDLLIPDQCASLAVAATHPEARGQGLGRLLFALGAAAVYEAGYKACETDWRMANLEASRVWPRYGYRPVMYRLSRRIDPCIAWAR